VVSPTEMERAKRSILTSSHSDIRPTQLPAPGPHFAAAHFHVMQVRLRGRRRQGNAANCLCCASCLHVSCGPLSVDRSRP
jgi:hypothetical protein